MSYSILDKVIAGTEEAESPKQFYYWSTLAAIAAVLKRNVYVDRYYFKVYPNIYVLLVARSGLRKGNPVAFASDLVKSVGNTRVIEGRSSIQAVVSELTKAHHCGTKVFTDACALVSSGEFSITLLEDKHAMTILTDLYDSQYLTEWKNRTKGGGTETLKEIGVTLLSASNEPLLKDVITVREKYGGFMGRTFLIYGDKKNTINSLINRPKRIVEHSEIVKDLTELSNLNGQIKWTPEAAQLFDDWYVDLALTNDHGSDDSTGLVERIDTHVLKIAMLIHLAGSTELILEKPDIERAIELCSPLLDMEGKIQVNRSGDSKSEQTKLTLKLILNEKKISRRSVLQKLWKDGINSEELNKIVDTLVEAKIINSVMEGKTIYYSPTKEALKIYGD
jgi:Protein of unknown function (DUF3987)